MSIVAAKTLTIALIGNPNTGKSTLFNALSGVRQHVGNYPGVTVEKKVGQFEIDGQSLTLIDLPGTYSLAPRSPDEMVTVDVLLGRGQFAAPDAILCCVDASNLERNLYLVSQTLELGRPTVLALNMTDVATSRGIKIDIDQLQKRLGIPVIAVQANKKIGLPQLKKAIVDCATHPAPLAVNAFPIEFNREVDALVQHLASAAKNANQEPPARYLAERLLLDTGTYLETYPWPGANGDLLKVLAGARTRLSDAGHAVPAVEAVSRYQWVGNILAGIVTRPSVRPVNRGDRWDKILTHRFFGLLIFAAVMILMFQAVFSWAEPIRQGLDFVKEQLAGWVESKVAEGALQSLLVDGIIAGVGSVITFVPQIAMLYLFIALLEDCGYMARAAYLMDRLMAPVGLSGKSFIPLLSSFGCAVPGIMATRVIENRRDRLATMMVAPLMSCSARLPVYGLLTAAFVPAVGYLGGLLNLRGLVMFGMYALGIIVAMAVAFLLKRTLLRGETPPFVMELPNYKWPAPQTVAHRIWDQSYAFLRQAGTVIFAVAILVWAAGYYPRNEEEVEGPHQQKIAQLEESIEKLKTDPNQSAALKAQEQELREIKNQIAGDYQRLSLLGQAGHFIEPVVRPLGWDWRIGCAVVASFPAREVVIATLNVIYNQGKDFDKDDTKDLEDTLQKVTFDGTDEKVFNLPVALSVMVFFALCAQCVSTLAVIKRETGTWRWPVFTFVYMTSSAYIGAWITYRVGMWLS